MNRCNECTRAAASGAAFTVSPMVANAAATEPDSSWLATECSRPLVVSSWPASCLKSRCAVAVRWVNEVGRPLGLDEEALRTHPMRHVLTMAIGASAPLAVNYYSVPLKGPCLMLMSSDGLHGVVDQGTLERILRGEWTTASLQERCQKLIDAAKEAGGPDNITVVLVRKSG